MLAIVIHRGKPNVVLPGLLVYECNYGPDRNQWNKWKSAEETFLLNNYSEVNVQALVYLNIFTYSPQC